MGAESGPTSVNASVVTAYAQQGFRYLGRTALTKEVAPAVPKPQNYTAPEPDEDGNIVLPTILATPAGDVYAGR